MQSKKKIAIISAAAVVLIIAILAFVISCNRQKEAIPAELASLTSYEVSGDIIKCNDKEMEIQLEDKNRLKFDITDVELWSYNGKENVDNGENEGDWATISYVGTARGSDTSKCKATYVQVKEGEEKEVTGKLVQYSPSQNNLTINSDGKDLTFDLTYAERHYKNGLKKGDDLILTYYGVINGVDTSNSYVYTIIDKDLEEQHEQHTETVTVTPVDDTVWTIGSVNVRAGSCETSEKIATLNKDAELHRTGLLSSGWSRIRYNGKTCYVITSALTTKQPAQKDKTTVVTVDEKVWTTTSVNLRTEASETSKKITTLDKNTELHRTGVLSNGWSRIVYNGDQTCYVISNALTTTEPKKPQPDKKITVKEVDETVWTTCSVNLRADSDQSTERIALLNKDTELHRTGILSNGWSRIDYNGKKTGYVITSALTTKEPKKPDPQPTPDPKPDPKPDPQPTPDPQPELHYVSGTVTEFNVEDAETSMVVTIDNRSYKLNLDDALLHIMEGNIVGSIVRIEYTGDLSNLSGVKVLNVWTEAPAPNPVVPDPEPTPQPAPDPEPQPDPQPQKPDDPQQPADSEQADDTKEPASLSQPAGPQKMSDSEQAKEDSSSASSSSEDQAESDSASADSSTES